MKHTVVTICLSICLSLTYSQEIPPLDLETIKTSIANPESDFFYPSLLAKFQARDSSLTPQMYQYLYYGYAFQDTYSPYIKVDDIEKFRELFDKKKYKKAIKIGNDILQEAPFNLNVILKMAVALKQNGQEELGELYTQQWVNILRCIEHSGTGETCEQGFVVTSVSDEYFFMYIFELSYTSQSLVGNCDMIDLRSPNDLNLESIFFDISLPFSSLTGMFD